MDDCRRGTIMTTQEQESPTKKSGTVIKESYYEPHYLALEKQRLWPRAWQMACREEELTEAGNYITYDIGDESIVIVRSPAGKLNAFYNVCQHRGRRLARGCGTAQRLRCPFHGWQWDLDGKNVFVTQRDDWGDELNEDEIRLKPVQCDTWGGFVFVNLAPDCEPLETYLGEAAKTLAPFQLDKMRFRWRKWLIMPCNWKIALEAFNEGYHVNVTHFRLAQYGATTFHVSRTHGIHSMFGPLGAKGTQQPQTITPTTANAPKQVAEFYGYLKKALDSNMTDTILESARHVAENAPNDLPRAQAFQQTFQMAMQDDDARGVSWPKLTSEQLLAGGTDWHIFPNMVLLPMATNCLGYRARPNGDDPNTCIFEVYQLERFPEGKAPRQVENLRNDDIYDEAFWGEILLQDFQQMEGTHRGLKSASYQGPRLNPIQEKPISNFHRVYQEYLSRP
jgi:phenylpropionate dioxygenase-like ring-hydroxylating dioxygenase large terminal subunit